MSGANTLNNCNVHSEFNYKLPDGFIVVHESYQNGFLSVADENNNGLGIEVRTKDLATVLPETEAVSREDYGDGSYRLNFAGERIMDPFNAIIVVPKDNFIVYAYFYEIGQSSTHSVFEEKAMQLVRSVALGGNNEKVWENCLCSALRTDWCYRFCKCKPADVYAVSVR